MNGSPLSAEWGLRDRPMNRCSRSVQHDGPSSWPKLTLTAHPAFRKLLVIQPEAKRSPTPAGTGVAVADFGHNCPVQTNQTGQETL
jgi:hypothetical protein